MLIVKILSCADDVKNMEQTLKDDGLIGVSGGRISVRRKLGEVIEEINCLKHEDEEGYVCLTYNHPETELGYAWDASKYSHEEAKSMVLEAYDAKCV
ncbi:hypothetical protein [Microbulbifer celer]|uniref:Uncharacterized protein n=1 Tax=Microbulbifer celer TaxID=435905 RepID=A0ABW3UF52_9GAMM|nr:hypothetical protein [Microbulbifer celer]UFN55886.1 hypothetical protein LPW13_09860 [Microbulbifer celer]